MRGFPGKREKARGNRKIKNMGEGWGSNGGGSRFENKRRNTVRSRSSFSREVNDKGHYSFLRAEEGVRALRWKRERRDRA